VQPPVRAALTAQRDELPDMLQVKPCRHVPTVEGPWPRAGTRPRRRGAEDIQVVDAVAPASIPSTTGATLVSLFAPTEPSNINDVAASWQAEGLPLRRGLQQPRVRQEVRLLEPHGDPDQLLRMAPPSTSRS